MAAQEVILETHALVKAFKGFVAVDGVSMRVRHGEIHALIGPNGAGKTTFFNLLTKFLQPTSGTIVYRGKDITHEKPADVARRGIVRSFQICAVFPHLTVLENVRVALQRALGTSFSFWRSRQSLVRLDGRAMNLLGEVRLESFAHALAADLPYGRKRALELATTLALEPDLMLLDEPTQGMGHEDVSRVTQLIKQVSANRTVLMVEHNMSVVASIADTISVLQRGQLIAAGPYSQVANDPQVIEAYMGASSSELTDEGAERDGLAGGAPTSSAPTSSAPTRVTPTSSAPTSGAPTNRTPTERAQTDSAQTDSARTSSGPTGTAG